MERRANYIAVGIFTLLVLAMAFGAVYWLLRYGENTNSKEVALLIPNSASGLKRGSGVLFNGLRVGSVTNVQLNSDDPGNVYARMLINADTPLRADTKVIIEAQPLTGLATVSLVGGSADSPRVLELDGLQTLKAEQSGLAKILSQAGESITLANSVLGKVDSLITSNTKAINTTVENVEKFSTAIAKNSDGVDELLKNVAQASTAISTLSKTLETVSGSVTEIVAAVDPAKVKSTLTNVDKITTDFAKVTGDIDGIMADAKGAVKSVSDAAANLNKTVAVVDAKKVANIIDNADGLTGELRTTLKKLDTATTGVVGIVGALEPKKIENTLTNVDKITTDFAKVTGDIDGVMADAKGAVKSVSEVAANLNKTVAAVDGKKVSRIVDNFDGLTGELRTTLGKVDGVLTALDGKKINEAISQLTSFTKSLEKTGGDIDGIMADAKSATKDVANFTKTLSENQKNIDKVIKDATVISERLITTSQAITRLVGRVDGLVEADGRGFVQEATDAAKSIRRIAQSFEARAGSIAQGLERFSTRGLGDIEALIGQSRQAVTRIETIVRQFESNPSRFLLSGQKVPEYRRQRR